LESVDDDDINTVAVTCPTDSSTQMWRAKERKGKEERCTYMPIAHLPHVGT
jgi:hypothetical protein